jgi:quercetin dioxygenase-like cupin family protein
VVVDRPQAVRETDLEWVDIGVRPGYKQKYVGFFDREQDIGVRVGSLYAEPYFHSPRHKHTFQQVRFVVDGAMRYGTDLYGPGDCLYLPEGVPYGPVKPEQTSGNGRQLHFVDMQFQGPSGIPYPHPDDIVRAQRELSETGSFEEGIYTDADGRKHDGYEAIIERLTGRQIEYPAPRLADYVVLRSTAHPWVSLQDVPGVEVKHLAYFFETGPNIKLVRLPAGAELPEGESPAQQVRYVLRGRVEFAGDPYEPISYVYYPPKRAHPALRATEDTELLVVQWLSRVSSQAESIPFCRL